MKQYIKVRGHIGEIIGTDGRLSVIKFAFGQFCYNTVGMEKYMFYDDLQLSLF